MALKIFYKINKILLINSHITLYDNKIKIIKSGLFNYYFKEQEIHFKNIRQIIPIYDSMTYNYEILIYGNKLKKIEDSVFNVDFSTSIAIRDVFEQYLINTSKTKEKP